jgi:hypothetical protein
VYIELRVSEGSMTVVLRPFGFAKATIEATDGPVSNAIDDTMGGGIGASIHLNGEGLMAARHLFPSDDQ